MGRFHIAPEPKEYNLIVKANVIIGWLAVHFEHVIGEKMQRINITMLSWRGHDLFKSRSHALHTKTLICSHAKILVGAN